MDNISRLFDGDFDGVTSLKDKAQQYFEEGKYTVEDIPLLRSVRNIDEETQMYLDSIDPAMVDTDIPAIDMEGATDEVAPHIPYGEEFEVDPIEPQSDDDYMAQFESLADDDYMASFQALDDEATPAGFAYPSTDRSALADENGYVDFANIDQDVEWTSLKDNTNWVYASSLMFEAVHGVPIYDRWGQITPAVQKILDGYGDGEDSIEAKVANYGLKEMAGFNYNIIDMAIDANNIMGLDDKLDLEKKQAFLYLLEQYDEVNTSWKTFADATKEVATDWTNWAGLLSLGAGTAASFGAKKLGKEVVVESIKATLRKGIKTSAKSVGLKSAGQRMTGLAALEGGLHMGYYTDTRQNVVLDAEAAYLGQGMEGEDYERFKEEYLEDNYSYFETAGMAAFGGVVGAGASVALTKGIGKLAEKHANRKLKKIAENHKKAVQYQLEQATKVLDNAPKTTVAKMIERGDSLEEVLEFAEKEAIQMAEKQGKEVVEKAAKVTKVKDGKWKVEGVEKTFKTKKAANEAATKVTKNQDPRPYVDDNVAFFKDAADVIRRMLTDPKSVDEVISNIDNQKMSLAQTEKFASMVNEAYSIIQRKWLTTEERLISKTLTDVERKEALEASEAALNQMMKAKEIKEHINAYAGRTLQDIQNWIIYKTEIGEAPSAKAIEDAHKKYYQKRIQELVQESQGAIDKAWRNGDYAKARRLTNQRNNSQEMVDLFKGLAEYDPRLANKLSDNPADNATLFEKHLEMSIAGYFSPTTVQYNTIVPLIKAWTMPFLDTLVQNPLKRAAWRKMSHQYAALYSARTAAVRSARMAMELEYTTLTADPARFYDGGVKTKGKFFKFARIFPRLVAFSDAYLQENVAASVLTAKNFDILMEEGTKLKLKGRELDAYIDTRIEKRVAESYDRSMNENIVKPIVEAANNLNLTGEAKEKYILKILNRKGAPESLKRLNDEDAEKMIFDFLYKKPFKRVYNKKGQPQWEYKWTENPIRRVAETSEEYAAKWDDFVKHHPILRLCTTIFWRTPVRLVNESMRLTPAVNALMPTFVDDLAGVNGNLRRARAITESYTGFALLMFTITKFAEGEITGGTNIDWSKKAARSNNEEEMQALHVELFGAEIPYARLEPLRAVMQFQVDVLEKHKLRAKKMAMGQGFGTEKELEDGFLADMGILMSTMIQVIRDTGLLTGAVETVEGIGKIATSTQDEEDSIKASTEFWKLTTSKLTGFFPSTIRKSTTAIFDADELQAPATGWDRLLQKIAPDDISIPRQYGWDADTLRNEATIGGLVGFAPAQPPKPEDKKSKKWHEVDEFMRDIEYLDLATVTRPFYRSKTYFGDVDMRKINVPVNTDNLLFDREISLYDLIHKEMYALNKNDKYTNYLHSLAKSDLPLGTPKGQQKSELILEVQNTISEWRKEAIERVMQQYPEIYDLHFEHLQRTEKASIAN